MDFYQSMLAGATGGGITILAQYIMHRVQTAESRTRDDKRKYVLAAMLAKPGADGWRKLATMSNVIGASPEETSRLLIDMDCRASETGSGGWAYIKDKPLPEPKEGK